jgi:hypothetical protein
VLLTLESDGSEIPTCRVFTRDDSFAFNSRQTQSRSTRSNSDSEQEWQNISLDGGRVSKPNRHPSPQRDISTDERRSPESPSAGSGIQKQNSSKLNIEILILKAHMTEMVLSGLERTVADLFPPADAKEDSQEANPSRVSSVAFSIAKGTAWHMIRCLCRF